MSVGWWRRELDCWAAENNKLHVENNNYTVAARDTEKCKWNFHFAIKQQRRARVCRESAWRICVSRQRTVKWNLIIREWRIITWIGK